MLGVGGTRCGCRSMSEKESLVKIFSFTWDTAALWGGRGEEDVSGLGVQSSGPRGGAGSYLWISGISGLCLNREEVLMPPLPASDLRSGVLLSACVQSGIQQIYNNNGNFTVKLLTSSQLNVEFT